MSERTMREALREAIKRLDAARSCRTMAPLIIAAGIGIAACTSETTGPVALYAAPGGSSATGGGGAGGTGGVAVGGGGTGGVAGTGGDLVGGSQSLYGDFGGAGG